MLNFFLGRFSYKNCWWSKKFYFVIFKVIKIQILIIHFVSFYPIEIAKDINESSCVCYFEQNGKKFKKKKMELIPKLERDLFLEYHRYLWTKVPMIINPHFSLDFVWKMKQSQIYSKSYLFNWNKMMIVEDLKLCSDFFFFNCNKWRREWKRSSIISVE